MQYRIIFCLVAIALLVGVVSADTLLLYANNDAQLTATSTSATWQTLRDAAGTTATDNLVNPCLVYITAHASISDRYIRMNRDATTFNGSGLNGGNVSAAILRGKYYLKALTLGGTNETAVVLGSPTNPLDFVAGDYNNLVLSTASELAPRFDFTSSGAGSNINFTFSAAGISTINTNNTPFTYYILDGDELDNSFSGTWGEKLNRYLCAAGVSAATEANRPYLAIEYTPSGVTPPVASFTCTKTFLRIPNSVTATDTSTNTPTSWEWSWGDGTANSTLQSPSHQYLKRGKFDIYLTATNAGGSGSTGATSVKVVGYENYY